MRKEYTTTYCIQGEKQHDEKMYAENDSEIIKAVINQMNMLLNSNFLKDWQHRPAFEATAAENGRQILHITF